MIFGGSSKSGAGHLNLTFSDTDRKLYDIPLRGDAFSPATLPASASLLASMFKCSNVPCSHGPQCVNFSSHYDRHDVLACGWPSDIVDTGAAVNVGACGWPSEIVDMGAAVPVGAWG